MSWKKIRLPILSVLTVISIIALILDSKGLLFKKTNTQTESVLATKVDVDTIPDQTAVPTPTTKGTTKPTLRTKATLQPTSSPHTNVTTDNNQNQSNVSNNTGGSQVLEPNTASTPIPTQKPVTPTTVPTTAPTTALTAEPANVQIWVRGWQYSTTGHQYSTDGDVKIFNGSTLVASGSHNSYQGPYKATNLPTNANLSVYFYMGSCGQVQNVNTGNVSALQQLDFHFSESTNCI